MPFLLALVLAFSLPAANLGEKVARIVDASPAAAHSFLGIDVEDLSSGHAILSRNAGRFFVPASNTKLFTTALALTRLGADYHFETRVLSAALPDANGRLAGDLVLKGSGDPSLTGRPIPYRKDAPAGNALGAIEELADQIFARGVRRVDGDIVGDDTAYAWEPYPPGWSADDAVWDYGAPVSALTLNDNMIGLTIAPGGKPGGLASLTLNPPLEYFWIDNRVRTGGETKIRVEREPGSPEIALTGVVSSAATETLAVDDPARLAAYALADALTRRGVSIHGHPVARHRPPAAEPEAPVESVVLASRRSPPLVDLLRVTDKISQNLYAELFLREVGRGSRQAGLEEMGKFLSAALLGDQDYRFEDGSGLSRTTLVTPRAIVQLLDWMYRSPNRDVWVNLLPVGAEDGSLEHRFGGRIRARAIHAKTGSLGHVRALSGYALVKGRHPLAFSVVLNNYNTPSTAALELIDRIVMALIE